MKRRKKWMGILTAICLSCAASVYADASAMDVSILPQENGTQKLVVTLTELAPFDEVVFQVSNPAAQQTADAITPETINEILLYADQRTADAEGCVRFSLQIPSATAEGRMRLSAFGIPSEQKAEESLAFYQQETLNQALHEIYAERADAAAVFRKLNIYKDSLGIRSALMDEMERLGVLPEDAVTAITDKEYTVHDYPEYTEKLYAALAMDAVNRIPDAKIYAAMLRDDTALSCAAALGLAANEEDAARYQNYLKLSESKETEIAGRLLQTKPYTKESFAKAFHQAVFMTCLADVKNSDQMEALLLASKQLVNGADRFAALGDKRPQAAATLLQDRNVTSLEAFETRLQAVCDNPFGGETGAQRPGGFGGSGGGGGGMGSSGGFSMTAKPEPEEAADTQKPLTADQVRAPFEDLAEVPWAKQAIEVLYSMGVVSGKEENAFRPDDSITREEFVKMAILTFDYEQEAGTCSFLDVDADAWYYRYICAAQSIGAVQGVSEEYFGIGTEISREQLITITYRLAKMSGIPFYDGAVYVPFEDDALISDYAREAVSVLAASGLITGDGTAVYPANPCTRAEAAKILYAMYLKLLAQ